VSTPSYPAACAHVVAISATDSNDRLASFSNYGNWITLSAPGTSILTTANGGGYGFWSGTSFASPIAAGVAALILSVNPALTNQQVLDILKQTADRPSGAGTAPDTYFGWGRVNAYRAVLAAEPPRSPAGRTFPLPHKGRLH
jgi:thermitase